MFSTLSAVLWLPYFLISSIVSLINILFHFFVCFQNSYLVEKPIEKIQVRPTVHVILHSVNIR